MFYTLSNSANYLVAGSLKFAEITRAVRQAHSQIKAEQELMADEFLRSKTMMGGTNLDGINAELQAEMRQEAEEQRHNLTNTGAQPAVDLRQRCRWIAALDDLQRSCADSDQPVYPLRNSIEFAIDTMRQGKPNKEDVEAAVILASRNGEVLTPEEAEAELVKQQAQAFGKYKSNVQANAALIIDLVESLVVTADIHSVESEFKALPDRYRFNITEAVTRKLNDHLDQLIGRGRWKGVPQGKKAEGKNWLLYRPATERVKDVLQFEHDLKLLETYRKQHAAVDPDPIAA